MSSSHRPSCRVLVKIKRLSFLFVCFFQDFLGIMCGPFKGWGILRLLEMIFSALALVIVLFRGWMVSPWGVWCEFVWFFCIIVPLFLTVMEAMGWNILLSPFLPNWADLCCGLTCLCASMIISATIIFGVVFTCLTCVMNIVCLIFSLVATIVFIIDCVRQTLKRPSGYMCSFRGNLRTTEAFIACIIITAAIDHFVMTEWHSRPFGMVCSVLLFFGCLLITVVIIVLNLLTAVQGLLCFGLKLFEFVFNIAAVVLYLLAIILWCVFGYRRYSYTPYSCTTHCHFADLYTVTIGAVVNLILYIVDLVFSFKSR